MAIFFFVFIETLTDHFLTTIPSSKGDINRAIFRTIYLLLALKNSSLLIPISFVDGPQLASLRKKS